MEVNNDRDDDSLDEGDYSQLKPLDDEDSEVTPIVEITNPQLFDLSGETESISTMGNPIASTSVTFYDDGNLMNLPIILIYLYEQTYLLRPNKLVLQVLKMQVRQHPAKLLLSGLKCQVL